MEITQKMIDATRVFNEREERINGLIKQLSIEYSAHLESEMDLIDSIKDDCNWTLEEAYLIGTHEIIIKTYAENLELLKEHFFPKETLQNAEKGLDLSINLSLERGISFAAVNMNIKAMLNGK